MFSAYIFIIIFRSWTMEQQEASIPFAGDFAAVIDWKIENSAIWLLVIDYYNGWVQTKFPGGTAKTPNETPPHAAARENYEETDLIVEEKDLTEGAAIPKPKDGGEGIHWQRFFFVEHQEKFGESRKIDSTDGGVRLGPPRWIRIDYAFEELTHSHSKGLKNCLPAMCRNKKFLDFLPGKILEMLS